MPFQSLPNEMMCKIFIEANHTSPFCLPNALSIPLVVTLVCLRWQTVALACQPLWSFYIIKGPELLRNGRLYLERAGNAGVHILAPYHIAPPNPEVYNLLTQHTVHRPLSLHGASFILLCRAP